MMREKEISQAELARRVGVSQPTIYGLIHKNKTGSVHLHKIARELDTTAAYLTGETDDPQADLPNFNYTAEERRWVDLLTAMQPKDRTAFIHLAERLADADGRPTVHSGRQSYKAG